MLSQEKKMDRKDWEKIMGGAIEFPFKISNLNINKIDNESISHQNFNNDDIQIYQDSQFENEIYIASNVGDRVELEGVLTLVSNSSEFIPNIAITSETKGEE